MKFNPHFAVKKIIQTLEKLAAPAKGPGSIQAASTLGELYYMTAREKPEIMETSLKFYELAAKQGCGYAQYWIGYIHALVLKKLDVAFKAFISSYKLGNINAAYQLFMLYSKAPEYLNPQKAYKCLKKSCDYGLQCFDEIKTYFKENINDLKGLDDTWKSWPEAELLKIFEAEIDKQSKKFLDAVQTDKLYKRPAVVFVDNKGNWFLSMQIRNVS
jgi:hypothetical protein